MRKMWGIVAVAAALALVATWYFASPWYTLSRMKAAANAQDGAAFSAFVDFPALREDMKVEMAERLKAEARSQGGELGGLGSAFGLALAAPLVDTLVSPAAIRLAFASRGALQEEAGDAARPPGLRLAAEPVLERRGLSEFLLTSRDQPGSGMVFRRHGLGWKLAGVELPPPGRADPVR